MRRRAAGAIAPRRWRPRVVLERLRPLVGQASRQQAYPAAAHPASASPPTARLSHSPGLCCSNVRPWSPAAHGRHCLCFSRARAALLLPPARFSPHPACTLLAPPSILPELLVYMEPKTQAEAGAAAEHRRWLEEEAARRQLLEEAAEGAFGRRYPSSLAWKLPRKRGLVSRRARQRQWGRMRMPLACLLLARMACDPRQAFVVGSDGVLASCRLALRAVV